MVELDWDDVQKKYEASEGSVVGRATAMTEKNGGPVAMGVDEVEAK